MKQLCLIISLFFFVLSSYTQSEVELKIQLLTPDIIGEATLDKEPFFEWIKQVNTEIETCLIEEKGNKEVIVLLSLHNDKDATITFGTKPEQDNVLIKKLKDKLAKFPSPRTKYTNYSLAVIGIVNEGVDSEVEFSPEIVSPDYSEMMAYQQLSMKEKKNALQNWIKTQVLPTIAFYETSVDTVFKGVLYVGEQVAEKKYLKQNVEEITSNNSMYWRATMEMSKGNQLIPFTKICMHIANGELDKAKRLLFVTSLFNDEKTLPALFEDELNVKLDVLLEELNKEINKGIELHDEGKYQEAIKHYENLLEIFPQSAWLNYELYFSKTAQIEDPEEVTKQWNISKKIIYACDPMYHMDVHAKTGRSGYLLFRRQEIDNLFTKEGEIKKDIINYADIALDLGNYDFAAQIYWLIITYFSEEDYEDRNMLAHYLYCLDKLGDTESKNNFKGNFKKEFSKIEKQRDKLMKESVMYKSFNKKG